MKPDGTPVTLPGPDCGFEYRSSALGELVILGAELLVKRGEPAEIRARMDELRAHRAATQPKGVRSAGCIFKNPRQLSAGALIDKAGLKGRRVGGARVSDKHANFIITDAGTSATDVLKLIEVVRETVYKRSEVYLELEIEVW